MTEADDDTASAEHDAVLSPELLKPLISRIPPGWWPHVEAPRGWWDVLHRLDADLADLDPRYELRRAARIDNELLYLTFSTTGGSNFARRIAQAQAAVRAVCQTCGRPGLPRTRSRTVLCDRHWHPMTAAERAFALSADIPEAWFSVKTEMKNGAFLARCEAEDPRNASTHLTERDMADLLQVSVRRVHELFEGQLLAGADHDGRVVYPRWQVTDDGRLLPGLPAVVRAAEDMDARSLQAIMESVDEQFDGLSPAQWLGRGRPLEPVLHSLAEWWWI